MNAPEWFRRTTWNETDRAEFLTRLKRSRTPYHKSQYLRIQAVHLYEIGTKPMLHAALELLDLLITEYPDRSQLSSALHQRAQCLSDLGDYEGAIESYRQSFHARRAAPAWQDMAYLHFGELAVALRWQDLYDEVLATLDEFGGDEVFPVHQYQAATIRSLIAEERGSRDLARDFAQAALAAAAATESPFRYHRTLGLVRFVDPEIMDRLRALAA